jgi:hypothetical protein
MQWRPGHADLIIGVNRAPICASAGVDWWAVSDYPMARDWREQIPGRPLVFAPSEVLTRFDLGGLSHEAIAAWCPVQSGYTAVRALSLAGYIGATTVACFGIDWTADPDPDGYQQPGTRRDGRRWQREAGDWNRMCAWLAEECGTNVERKPWA